VAVSASVLKLLAPAMVGKALDDLLWCRPDGQPLRPPTTTHWFGAAVKRCQAADEKFPRVTVHELRHTAASLMIASGANVKTVQSQLGHKAATMLREGYATASTPPAVSACLSNIAQRELLTWSTLRAKVNLPR
jgi:integrase